MPYVLRGAGGKDTLRGASQSAPALGVAVDVVGVADLRVLAGRAVDVDRQGSRSCTLDLTSAAGQDLVAVRVEHLHAQLGQVGQRQRVAEAGDREDHVLDIGVEHGLLQVEEDLLGGHLAAASLLVSAVAEGAVEGLLVLLVAGADPLVTTVGDHREDVQVDASTATFDTPAELDAVVARDDLQCAASAILGNDSAVGTVLAEVCTHVLCLRTIVATTRVESIVKYNNII